MARELIYIYVPQLWADGKGDLVVNVQTFRRLQQLYPDCDFEFLIHPSSEGELLKLTENRERIKYRIWSPGIEKSIPHARAVVGYFSNLDLPRSTQDVEIKKSLMKVADNYLVWNSFPKRRRWVEVDHNSTYSDLKLEENVEYGLAYTNLKESALSYVRWVLREATQLPYKKFVIYLNHEIPADYLSKSPSNVSFLQIQDMSAERFESELARSTLPVLVTGTSSLNSALNNNKVFIYETRPHRTDEAIFLRQQFIRRGLPSEAAEHLFSAVPPQQHSIVEALNFWKLHPQEAARLKEVTPEVRKGISHEYELIEKIDRSLGRRPRNLLLDLGKRLWRSCRSKLGL